MMKFKLHFCVGYSAFFVVVVVVVMNPRCEIHGKCVMMFTKFVFIPIVCMFIYLHNRKERKSRN